MVLFGSVGLSAGAREWAMRTGREVVLCSRRGAYQGQVVGREQVPPLERVQAQLAFAASPAATGLSRTIVEAKIRKQIVVLQRFGRRSHREVVQDAVHQMRQAMLLLPECAQTEEVMGIEGAAAAAYFPALGRLVPDELAFELRSRQPPRDLVNAALSFGYTVLLGECESALLAAGLDTRVGVLHRGQGRRPSLALDLLEEFRPLVVDQCVLNLTRGRTLTPAQERREDGKPGVLLNRGGRESFLRAYEARMLSTTKGALPDFTGSLRRHLYRQAQRLRATIEDDSTAWTGLAWR